MSQQPPPGPWQQPPEQQGQWGLQQPSSQPLSPQQQQGEWQQQPTNYQQSGPQLQQPGQYAQQPMYPPGGYPPPQPSKKKSRRGVWTTTHTFTGNGIKKTSVFTVGSDWKIIWKCTSSSFYGGQYNIIVGVDGSDGSMVDPVAINTVCKTGTTGDSTEEHSGGSVYLDVNSEGAWTITVQELK